MRFLVIIIGLLSTVLLLTAVVFVSIYFTRKVKDESFSTESLLNITMSSTIQTSSSNITRRETTIVADGMIDTTVNIDRNPTITTPKNIMNKTSIEAMGSTSVDISNRISTATATTNMVSVSMISSTSTDVSTTTTGSTTTTTAGSMTTTTAGSTTTTITGSTKTTTTPGSTTTTTSQVCLFGFEPMISVVNCNLCNPIKVAAGQFNNDSYIDIAVANYNGQSVGILLGNGDGTFLPEKITFTGNNTDPYAIGLGDFNNDGQLDVVILSIMNGNFVVLLGNGDGTFRVQKSVSIGSDSYPFAVAVGYIDKDNILDLAISGSGNDRILIYTGYGNGTFQSQESLETGILSAPSGVALGDLNNDNNTDLVTANWGVNTMSIFLGYGNGSFQSRVDFTVGETPIWIDIADFNGDNNLDVAVLNTYENTVGIFLGFGNCTFSEEIKSNASNSTDSGLFATADINNDGKLDISIANMDMNSIQILLGRGNGTFQTEIMFSTGANSWPFGLAVADFNRDNLLDIAVANYYTENVGVFLQTC